MADYVCRIETRNDDGTFMVRMSADAVFDHHMEFGVENFKEREKDIYDALPKR